MNNVLKLKTTSLAISTLILMAGCMSTNSIDKNNDSFFNDITAIDDSSYQGYRTIDPIQDTLVTIYDSKLGIEKDVHWESIIKIDEKRKLLPIQSSQISVSQTNEQGKISYLTAALTREKGSYLIVMDYMKYRVEAIFDESQEFIGNGRVGIGIRIKADVETTKKGINLGSIIAIGAAAENGSLSGGISVDVIGIDSKDITNLIPMTSEINQTAIQSALQALASVNAKLWEEDVDITPHLIAMTNTTKTNESKIRSIVKGEHQQKIQ